MITSGHKKKLILTTLFVFLLNFVFILGWAVKTEAGKSLMQLNEKWLGDFDGMADRNVIRALVPYSKTFYFLDGADQRGLTYDFLKEFEKHINKELKRNVLKVRVVIIPTKRNKLLKDLASGLGDIAAGNLTITSKRKKQIDFSNPGLSGVDEILVTCPKAPQIKSIDDLAGKKIFVRPSSSYHESLQKLNVQFKKSGKKPIKIKRADEILEDEDILEMMCASMIPMTVIDSHKAKFWSQIFNNLKFHYDIKLRKKAQIAWAIRKNSPLLKQVINDFGKTHKKGTLMGNILFKRYLEHSKWVSNPMEKDAFDRFESAVKYIKKYSNKYDFDWAMIAALAYQESKINQNERSAAGAVGVMQILPSTAADPNVNIPDIDKMEANIHAGVKYLRFIRDRYFENEPMDPLNKVLFSIASYNAGPRKINQLRTQARQMGVDPDVWFNNVEIIAAKRIGRETVQYVSNIYKYYIAYRTIVDTGEEKKEIKQDLKI